MGWQYLVVCLFDFLVGPVFNAWFAYYTKTPLVPWVPLTIQGGGMYHIAMGAIVGITSYAKTQERVAVTNNGQSYQPFNQNNLNQQNYQNPNLPVDPASARNRIINPNSDSDPVR